MIRADLHVHTEASYDCATSLDEMLSAASERGLDVVAVTDHDAIEASLEAVERAPEYGLLAVPGVEVSTADGHLIGLGVEELPPAGEDVHRTVKRVRDQGGLAVIPHPFQRLRHGVGAVRGCDAVEVYNSRMLVGLGNRRAREFARDNGLPEVGGSDAHIAEMVGQTHTDVDAEAEREDVLAAIKAGRTEVRGKRTPISHTAQQFATKAPARLRRDLLSLIS